MIKYDGLWRTMKRRGITQYDSYTYYGINRSILHRLRTNANIETNTVDKLCRILNCDVCDILEYVPDEE